MATIEMQPLNQESYVPIMVDKTAEAQFAVALEGTRYNFSLHWESPGGGWVRNMETGEVRPFYFWLNGEEGHLWFAGKIYKFNISTPQARRQKARGGGKQPASGEIKAPMPGSILKILVAPGDQVEANAPLLIMESMKMEMTLTAPAEGWVAEVACQVGQMVEMHSVLIRMEAVKDEPVLS